MEKTKLEIGVFHNPKQNHDEWIYQDIVAYPNVDLVCDSKNLPLESESLDEVFASHIIEHFYFDEVEYVLREWLRVLKHGGKLTIIVPDFFKVWEMIVNDEKPKFMEKYVDTVEDWGARIMSNHPDRPDSHRNHHTYKWYLKKLEELGCEGTVERSYTWVVPEVIISVIKK